MRTRQEIEEDAKHEWHSIKLRLEVLLDIRQILEERLPKPKGSINVEVDMTEIEKWEKEKNVPQQ